jgi:hypothetical protein
LYNDLSVIHIKLKQFDLKTLTQVSKQVIVFTVEQIQGIYHVCGNIFDNYYDYDHATPNPVGRFSLTVVELTEIGHYKRVEISHTLFYCPETGIWGRGASYNGQDNHDEIWRYVRG